MAKTVRLVGFLRPAPSDWPEDALRPKAFIGRYEIAGVLRHNDVGITYAARDPHSGRDVAIQEYLPIELAVREIGSPVRPSSTRAVEHFRWGRDRFLVEARKLAALAGTPGIVRVHEVLVANGTACMVMDRVRGDSLAARLARFGSLPPMTCERMLRALLDGLDRAHRAGVLHLGIEPANIVLDARDQATLVDFGAARLALTARLQSATTIALSDYAAPEQFAGGEPGPHTDIYALAATLHHCVTGRAPLPATRRSVELQIPSAQAAAGRYAPRLLAGIDAGLGLGVKSRVASVAEWRRTLGKTYAPAVIARAAAPRPEAKARSGSPSVATTAVTGGHRGRSWLAVAALPGMIGASIRRTALRLVKPSGSTAARIPAPRLGFALRLRALATVVRARWGRWTGLSRNRAHLQHMVGALAAVRARRARPENATAALLPGAAATRERCERLRQGRLATFARHVIARGQRAALRRGLVPLPGPAGARSRRRWLQLATAALLLVAAAAAVPAYDALQRSALEPAEAALRPPTTQPQETAAEQAQGQTSARRAAEEKAQAEAAARQQQDAEAKARAEAEVKRVYEQDAARRAAEEKARAEAAARQQQEAETKARAEAEARRAQEQEAARRAAEEKARTEAAARQQQEAETKARAEAEARRAQEQEAARRAAEERAQAEAAARQQLEAEMRARVEAVTRRAQEQEASRREAEEKARTAATAERRLDEIITRLVAPAEALQTARPQAAPTADERRQAEATERGLGLTPTDRARVQIALSSLGYDTKGVDEVFGPRSRQMIAAWQKKQGVPDTGFLTAQQLQTLRRTAVEALGRYDAEKRRLDDMARPKPRADASAHRPPSAPSAAAPGRGTLPAPPAATAYRGSARLPLYPGADDRDFAEYTLNLKVTDANVSGSVTRYCPGCTADDREGRVTYTCTPAALRPERTFNLNCNGVSVWGPLDRPRIDNGRDVVAVQLGAVGGSQE